MVYKAVLVFFSLLVSVLPLSASASNGANIAPEKTVLTVAIAEVEYYPYNYYKDGKLTGFSVDVLDYFESNSKYDFEFIVLPWPRVLRLVEIGQIDIVLTLFKTSEREKNYFFIEPAYGNEINKLFTLKGNDIEFDGQLKKLAPYSIGTIRKYSYGKEFDQASYLNKMPALSEEVLLKLLLNKRIDMMIGNPFAFNKLLIEREKLNKVRAIEPHIAITPVYLALTRKREDSTEINRVLGQLTKQLKASSYYKELLKRYQLNF